MQDARNIKWHAGDVRREDRWRAVGGQGRTIWLTGLSGSGKSTIAVALEAELVRRGLPSYRLDGDNLRHGLNRDLGFSQADRDENIRRAAEVALLFADFGATVIAGFISPYRATRAEVRARHEQANLPFFEVFVDTPLEACEARDPKGLYAKARRGEITGLTGLDAPFEAPTEPELRLDGRAPIDENVAALLELLG